MPTELKKWIVSVPVTILVCTEVEAPTKSSAIIAANEKVNNLSPYYDGVGVDLSRPSTISFEDNGEDGTSWFDEDSVSACDIFLSDKAVARLADEEEEAE